LGNVLVAAQLAASQEGLKSVELVKVACQIYYYFYYYLFKLQMGFYPMAVVLQ
jgi:hypothetical protein